MALSLRTQANEILSKNGYKHISEHEMATYIGFTANEKYMLKLFWESTFNESMIYLSDELILNHLTDETERMAITNFIKRILIPNFKEGGNYKVIDKNHDLVKKYNANSGSSNLMNQKNQSKITTKRYFAVTGETFKELLMLSRTKKGIETRRYYLKIEQLAKLMIVYVNMLEKHLAQKQLEEEKNRTKKLLKKKRKPLRKKKKLSKLQKR